MMKYRRTVNQYRHPDTDIELQLTHKLMLLNEAKCQIMFHHVWGHQDKKPQNKLEIEEELNVFADILTNKARTLPSVAKYDKSPVNRVNFNLYGKYINSNYPQCVSSAYHSLSLHEYYTMKHGRNNKTIDSIWWQAYYQSITKLTDNEKLCIRNSIHNLWPTLY
jgi:hypothetical protein